MTNEKPLADAEADRQAKQDEAARIAEEELKASQPQADKPKPGAAKK